VLEFPRRNYMADIEKVVAEEIKLLKKRLRHLEAVAKTFLKRMPTRHQRRFAAKAEAGVMKEIATVRKMSAATKKKLSLAAKARWAKIKKKV
jgi:hypothetical protein